MQKFDVVIIDSGLDIKDSQEYVSGFSVRANRQPSVINDDITDDVGHGTIIYNIIRKYSPESSVLVVKLFDAKYEISEDDLIYALQYIKDNIKCGIINMSLGLKICYNISGLKKVCADIAASGTAIVAAFDNHGCHSYPACFDEVIGIDNNNRLKNIFDFEYVESSPVNIRAKGGIQHLKLDSNRVVISGSSIACAYVTAYIANNCKSSGFEHTKVLEQLKKSSQRVYNAVDYNNRTLKTTRFDIRKAAVFPFSKEIHAFLRFNDMLPFHIQHYYDTRYSGRVGVKIKRFYSAADDNIYIEDIDKAGFDDIDTVIIGHLDELNSLLKYDYRKNLLERVVNKGINIYSFDPLYDYAELLKDAGIQYFDPKIDISHAPQNTFDKLYRINKPVVGIFGTSSRQGKFSLQLTLKRLFEKNDYSVGSIGSEPHSLLFGMDYVYPMGYNSSVMLNPWQSVTYLNQCMQRLCESDKEIILVASQAASTPHNFYNLMDFPIKQSIFLMGVQPDAIILCINPYDDVQYIKNSIQALQGLSDSKVVALVMYPMTVAQDWRNMYNTRIPIEQEDFIKTASVLTDTFELPVFLLGEDNDMNSLCKCLIDYF